MNKNQYVFGKATTTGFGHASASGMAGNWIYHDHPDSSLVVCATLRLLELNGQKGWYPIPPEFLIYFRNFDPFILVKVGLTLVISFLVYTVFLLITYFLNTLFGPDGIFHQTCPLKKKKRNDWFFYKTHDIDEAEEEVSIVGESITRVDAFDKVNRYSKISWRYQLTGTNLYEDPFFRKGACHYPEN